MLTHNVRLVRLGLRIADLVALSVAFPIAYLLRDGMVTQTFPGLYPIGSYWPVLVLTLLLWIAVSWATKVYDVYRIRPVTTELFRVARAVVLVAWAMLALGFLTRQHGVSRLFVGLYFVLALVLLVIDRIAIRYAARMIGRHAINRPRFAVVGCSEFGREVVRSVERSMRSTYDFAGFISDGDPPAALAAHKVLGRLDDLSRLLRTQVLDEVIFALPRDRLDAVEEGVQLCQQQGIGVRVCVDVLVHGAGTVTIDDTLELPMLSFTTAPSDAVALAVKRAFDVLVSAAVLVLLAPVFLIVSAAIWIESPGAVLAKERRVGINGREFWLHAFRTGRPNANGSTRIGTALRRTGLNALPQFWNVFRGEMSIVGPRAPTPDEVLRFERWQRRCLSMKPGITCSGRELGEEETGGRVLELELRYIDSWSLWRDFKIVARSIPAIFTGRGTR